MKRLIALVIVGVVSMALSGCGHEAPKPTEIKVESPVVPAVEAEKPAVEAEKPVVEAAPTDAEATHE